MFIDFYGNILNTNHIESISDIRHECIYVGNQVIYDFVITMISGQKFASDVIFSKEDATIQRNIIIEKIKSEDK